MGPTNEELGYTPPTETPVAPTDTTQPNPFEYTGGQDTGNWYDTTPVYDPSQFDTSQFDTGSMDFSGGDFSF